MEFPVPAAIIICFCFWGAVCRITITFFRPAASLWIITPKHFRTAGWLLQTKISTNFNTICVICLSVWGITSDLCASIIINRAVTFYWFPCTAIRITFVLIVAIFFLFWINVPIPITEKETIPKKITIMSFL